MLDRGYFEGLSLRDLRGLLDGAGVRLRRGPWGIALDRAEDVGVASVFGHGDTAMDALLAVLEQASAAGWFNGEEKR